MEGWKEWRGNEEVRLPVCRTRTHDFCFRKSIKYKRGKQELSTTRMSRSNRRRSRRWRRLLPTRYRAPRVKTRRPRMRYAVNPYGSGDDGAFRRARWYESKNGVEVALDAHRRVWGNIIIILLLLLLLLILYILSVQKRSYGIVVCISSKYHQPP